jgi:cytochrome c oxidase subunit 2
VNLLAVDMSPFSSAGPVDDRMQYVYTWVWYGSLFLGILVIGLLLIAFFRFRRKADDEEPEQVHGNTRLEITWTAVPFAILFTLFIVTALNMGFINNANASPNALTYSVEGQQFQWVITYPNGQKSVNYLFVPQDTPVNLDLTSRDVNHSLYLPNLGGQMNALPGQTNHMWIQAKGQGVWYGQCTELCGYGHHIMLIQVISLPIDKYNSCVNTGKSINPKDKNCQPTGAS